MLTTILATATHRPDINASAGHWASHRIWGRDDGFKDFASVTVLRDDQPIAAIILHDWQPHYGTIELSMAGHGYWQTRRVINEVMALCFDAMGCQTVIVRAPSDNAKTIKNARLVGFAEAVLPNVCGAGVDQHVFTLTGEAWRSSRLATRPKPR